MAKVWWEESQRAERVRAILLAKKKKETKQGLLEDKGDIATEEKNKTKQNTSAF